MRIVPIIDLSLSEKQRLTQLARSSTALVREARRASIVLLAAQGLTNRETAEAALGIGRVQVGRWRTRYARDVGRRCVGTSRAAGDQARLMRPRLSV